MESYSIVYISNDDVGAIIKGIGAKIKRAGKNVRKAKNELAPTFVESEADILKRRKKKRQSSTQITVDSKESCILPETSSVEILDEGKRESGKLVYSFKRSKKCNQMEIYAGKSSTKRHSTQVSKTKQNVNFVNQTSQVDKKDLKTCGGGFTTMHHLRGNSTDEQSIDPEQEDFTSKCDNEICMERTSSVNQNCIRIGSAVSTKKTRPSDREIYFDTLGSGSPSFTRTTTSDRTLQTLKHPRMPVDQLFGILQKYTDESQEVVGFQAVKKFQSDRYEGLMIHFNEWMFYLCNKFNILLFGLGSKRDFINSFCSKMLSKHHQLVVNGFFPGLSIKSILTSICEDILKCKSSAHPEEQLEMIRERFDLKTGSKDHLFIIIHNIDGMTLRNSKSQMVLSQLAEMTSIHIVASIDHINAPLIWDQAKISRFHWLWYDVTTYLPYKEETSFERSLLVTGAGHGMGSHGTALAFSGLLHVASSLTSNARGVFRLLSKHQLEEEEEDDEKNKKDLSFTDLYQKSREHFFVNCELTLRAHLTEFLDHKLVQIRKGSDGGEYISVPLDPSTLRDYLEHEAA